MNPTLSGSPDAGVAGAGEATERESATQSAATPRRRGRPRSHSEQWTKVTVVLMDREIAFLDSLVADIRAASGPVISRSHLIRALIDALAESDLDLTSSRSEKELTAAFAERLRDRSTGTPAGRL